MATSKIELQYDLKQNNMEGSRAFEKWYPRAVRTTTLNLRGLAEHIQSHGSLYTRDVVEGVMAKFRDCILELVSQGVAVKLDGLGTFYTTLEAKGADSPISYDINSKLEGIHIRFIPENNAEDRITSRALAKMLPMKQRMIFDKAGVPKKVSHGQLVDYGSSSDDTDNYDNDDNNDNNG